MSDTSIRPTGSCTTSNLTSPACAAVILNIGLRIVRAIAGVVVVQGFDAVFVGGQQVFEHLFHGTLLPSNLPGRRRCWRKSPDRRILHHADKFQVAFVARKLPQGFVGVFQGFKFRYDLFQDTVFRCFDRYQSARRLDAVGSVGDLRTGFRRHECGQGGVAQTVFDDVGAQAFPVAQQWFAAHGIQVFFCRCRWAVCLANKRFD